MPKIASPFSFYKKLVGFTLIELLVVVSLIGILITVGLNSFSNAQQKGRDSRRKEDLKAISTSLVAYYKDNVAFAPKNTISPAIEFASSATQPWIPGELTPLYAIKYQAIEDLSFYGHN